MPKIKFQLILLYGMINKIIDIKDTLIIGIIPDTNTGEDYEKREKRRGR